MNSKEDDLTLPPSPHSVKLIIHVGPHKTATTSIQYVLRKNAEKLLRGGISYPRSPHFSGAHHHVPSLLMGKDLRIIGIEESTLDTINDAASWLSQARKDEAHTILISAEDFCVMSEHHWQTFAQDLSVAEHITGISISEIAIAFTERELESRARSTYAETVRHGNILSYSEMNPTMADILLANDKIIFSLSQIFAIPITWITVPYVVESEARNPFLKRWLRAVVGEEITRRIVSDPYLVTINRSSSALTTEELLTFNKVNSPRSQDVVYPFHAPLDNPEEVLKAHLRLEQFLNVAQKRDVAQTRLDTSFSRKAFRIILRLFTFRDR